MIHHNYSNEGILIMHNLNCWDKVAKYVEAGNLLKVMFSDDFSSICLSIIYGDELEKDICIEITCTECAYFDWKRRDDHEKGSSIILEAYLHKASTLIESLQNHKLESKAGCLFLENKLDDTNIFHLEIIGEITLNIICSKVSFEVI